MMQPDPAVGVHTNCNSMIYVVGGDTNNGGSGNGGDTNNRKYLKNKIP